MSEDYFNLNELWYDTLINVYHHGDDLDSRVGKTKEIIAFQAALTQPLNNIILGYPNRRFSLSYACAEILWYLSFTDDIELIQAYAPSYSKYCENGKAYGAYGKRLKENPGFVNEDTVYFKPNGRNQIEALIQHLKETPNTRQAILSLWDSGDLIHAILADHKDLPCTLTIKFFVRNDFLHCITDMRSNDAWLGLPYDIFCFTTLQRIIAEELGLQLGCYYHQAGSEHIYECNYKKVERVISNYEVSYCALENAIEPANHYRPLKTDLEIALDLERVIRTKKTIPSTINNLRPVFKDLVLGAASRWVKFDIEEFDSPLFTEYFKR